MAVATLPAKALRKGASGRARDKRYRKADIRYVVFAGGGAKGIAHVAALAELEEQGLVDHVTKLVPDDADKDAIKRPRVGQHGLVEGYAGASIGAIVATLASCGWTATAIRRELLDSYMLVQSVGDPEGLLEGSPGLFNETYSGYTRRPGSELIPNYSASSRLEKALLKPLMKEVRALLAFSAYRSFKKVVEGLRKASVFREDELQYLEKFVKWPSSGLLVPGSSISDFILMHLGINTGSRLRYFIHRSIQQKLSNSDRADIIEDNKRRYKKEKDEYIDSITFAQHRRIFNTRLAVAGSNIETGESHIFSAETTPDMPIADAVRISASFPILFRPIFITQKIAEEVVGKAKGWKINSDELRGVWIDGGAFNNLPWQVFPNVPRSNGARSLTLSFELGESKAFDLGGPNGKTNDQARRRLDTAIGSYAAVSLGAAEHSVTNSYGDADGLVVTLDPGPFDTLDIAKYSEIYMSPNGEDKLNSFIANNRNILMNHLASHFR